MVLLKSFFVFLLVSSSLMANARVRDYQTTRLKATGGAGVGSVLLNESTILNPASIGFFDISAFYYQRDQFKLVNPHSTRTASDKEFPEKSHSNGFILADAKDSAKGALAYFSQKEGPYERQRATLSGANRISDKVSLGFFARYTRDVARIDSTLSSKKYFQGGFGTLHVVDPNLTIGTVIIDPFKSEPHDTKAILGFQYVFRDLVSIIGDVGTNYYQDLSDYLLYRAGAQVNFLSDLYLRAGLFNDKGQGEKGNGYGLGWIGPKLVLDLAYNTTKNSKDPAYYLLTDESTKEFSFSATYQF